MIKKILIAFAIMCAPVMTPAATVPAQSQSQASEESFMDTFVKEFNKECPVKTDENTTLRSAQFRKDTNTLIFNLTVEDPELPAAVFQGLADDPDQKKALATGFLSGNDDLKTMLVEQGCTVIFSFIFPLEDNKRVNFVLSTREIRQF